MADILGVNKKMAQVVVRQMIETDKLTKKGETRAAKYFLAKGKK